MTENRLDILYVGFVLGHGGDAAQMLELAAGMAALRKRVRVVVPVLPTTVAFAETASLRGIEVVRTPLLRASASGAKQIPEDLLELFRTNPAETLHLHTGDVCLSRTVPQVLGTLAIPPDGVFVTVHSAYDTLVPGDDRATAWALASQERINGIACPSQHSYQTQLRYDVAAERLIHIPNGVDLARFRNGNGERIRHELNLSRCSPLIVFTSRLDAQKRPIDALMAFSQIAGEFPDTHIAFVGSGTLEGELRAYPEASGLSDRVHFPGHRHDVADWLAAATCWALPTETENFSLAVLEALAAGCPILSTLCNGNDEVLVDGYNAITHSVGDVAGITNGMRAILRDASLRSRLSAAARTTSEGFSVERMVERYSEWYEKGTVQSS